MATTSTRRRSGTTDQPTGEVVKYKIDGDDREHYGSRTSAAVVEGLEAGTVTIVEEIPPDAPVTDDATAHRPDTRTAEPNA